MVPILINKDVFKSTYNDLKFMVQNWKFVCTNLMVYLKLTQHCKSTVLILKKKKKKNHQSSSIIFYGPESWGVYQVLVQVFGHFSEKNVAPTYKFSHSPAP